MVLALPGGRALEYRLILDCVDRGLKDNIASHGWYLKYLYRDHAITGPLEGPSDVLRATIHDLSSDLCGLLDAR